MYYPLLKFGNNEMKALRELKESSRNKLIPIVESKRIKPLNIGKWENAFNTLGSYLKERVKSINFIYDFNCAIEELGSKDEVLSSNGEDLVVHCMEKMREHNLSIIPCFQHDSPEWLIDSIIKYKTEEIAIRIRCHDFQEPFDRFVFSKLKEDLLKIDESVEVTIILDFFNIKTTTTRIKNAINTFKQLNPVNIVFLSTACPENANEADAHGLTLVNARHELNTYYELSRDFEELHFGDYTTRLKGEVLTGFNYNLSYFKIFYSTETDYYIAKSKLIRDGGEDSFYEICQQIVDQDFYPGEGFSFGDLEIKKCADKEITISDHQAPIAISVNHHIETTIKQL
ncbi:beta family protein [Psychrobacillus soli]|uniref:T4 beta protein n=1 Tax=Psychrobacillus soli TaxID=1543965 RepID=A0A544TJL3_9BACI|nr:hypothetical protein [Psychrobacillus soli]TQR17647.1 hypothetical protein FG383_04830 [Psychrobacillus soli]